VDKKILISALALAVLAITLFSLSSLQNPPEPTLDLSFAEVSLEDDSCPADVCLTEYIIASNGMAIRSIRHGGTRTDMELRAVDQTKAAEAISEISRMIDTNTLFLSNSPQYHIYAIFNGFKKAYYPRDDLQGKRMQQIAESLYGASSGSPEPFIQFVFWKQGEPIQDYHIFSDGTAINSQFTEDTEILNSRMFVIPKAKMSGITSALPGFSGREGNFCGREGFIYGYVLVLQNGEVQFAYTCGAGEDPADGLFNFLLENIA